MSHMMSPQWTLFKLTEAGHKQSPDFRRLTCLLSIWSRKAFVGNHDLSGARSETNMPNEWKELTDDKLAYIAQEGMQGQGTPVEAMRRPCCMRNRASRAILTRAGCIC